MLSFSHMYFKDTSKQKTLSFIGCLVYFQILASVVSLTMDEIISNAAQTSWYNSHMNNLF